VGRAAEVLSVLRRMFLNFLEGGIPVNRDFDAIRDYVKEKYRD